MHSDGKLLNSTSALYICWHKKSFPNPPYGSEHRVDITESAHFPTWIFDQNHFAK
jgi:hypothetical protein